MLDLETLGTGNNACILSIGAVKFDPFGEGLQDDSRFEVFIDPQSCTDAGLVIDASTVMWWMHPDRCYRTMVRVMPDTKLARVGVHHSAVDDAATQALHLQRILKGVTK
jgi:DNA polymerase III epsilon subunit-like protein